MSEKLFFVVNVDWFFLSHRLPIALEAQRRGYAVTIVTIETDKREEIESYGFRFIGIPTSRSGTNFLTELKAMFFLWKLYRAERPAIVHHVGVKPVTYGSVAGRLAGLPKIVNALSGMGYLFINRNQNRLAHFIVMRFFRFGFNNPNLRFILQNNDDMEDVRKLQVLRDEQLFLIKGSGVDLEEFRFSEPPASEILNIVLPARLLWDKGISEFVEAARILHTKYAANARFLLAGNVDEGNISSISEKQILNWQEQGYIEWIGFQKEMVPVLSNAHIVVLPSYREGLPKSLIEACAIGRPIVTTDVPGCREVVEHGRNGFLVPARDAQALADAIAELITDKTLRIQMGKESRKIAEQLFSIDSVICKTFGIYQS
jgi:glycosyltransferase involved in cell wall biosynthesis